MAKALFFIEALALVAISAIFPIWAGDLVWAFLAPMAVALLLPLCASLAVRPLAEIRAALACAFLGARPIGKAEAAPEVFAELSDFAAYGGAIGLLLSLVLALPRLLERRANAEWLPLGCFWILYGLVAAVASRILKAVVEGLALPPVNEDKTRPEAVAFVRRYALSPREWETASCIVDGLSYKETAYRLEISVRTVKAHIASVYKKTGTGDKVGLLLLLRQETTPESLKRPFSTNGQ